MKINKIYSILLILFLISSCSTKNVDFLYTKVGNKYKTTEISYKEYNMNIYRLEKDHIYDYYDKNHIYQKEHTLEKYYEKEKNKFYNDIILNELLIVNLPNVIEGSYTKNIFGKKTNKKYTTNRNSNFCIYFSYNDLLIDDFKDNLKISLIVNNSVYKPNINNKKFIFNFPIQIKNVNSGILVIDYKGIKKEINFEYKSRTYYKN